MKFLIKLSIIFFVFTGYHFTSYDNYFSKIIYKTAFSLQKTKNYISSILLQKNNINNSSSKNEMSELMNEYFLTIFNADSINENFKKILEASNFSILDLKNSEINFDLNQEFNFLNDKNFLVVNSKNENSISEINEEVYRFYRYKNFSIAYLKPILKNEKDLLKLYTSIKVIQNSSYIPIVIIDKNNLNENLLPKISQTNCVFIILNDEFSISNFKNIPIINLGNLNDFNISIQINLFISKNNLNKLRLKVFPTNKFNKSIHSKDELENILKSMNNNSKFKPQFSENIDYIYFDCDILKNSY